MPPEEETRDDYVIEGKSEALQDAVTTAQVTQISCQTDEMEERDAMPSVDAKYNGNQTARQVFDEMTQSRHKNLKLQKEKRSVASKSWRFKYKYHNDMANRLGIQSIRGISLVDNDITQDLPCMDFTKLKELLSLYGSNNLLWFDLLELADCCKVKTPLMIFDKREHSRKSLLQHNLCEFQGPALVAILKGATLTRGEVCSLQLLSQWRVKGTTFFASTTTQAPAAKMFSLIGTNLGERSNDQFNPMLLGQDHAWSTTDSTIIWMPLSSAILKDGLKAELYRVKHISDQLLENTSKILIFLKSVSQILFSTWEQGNAQPHQDYLLHIDSASAIRRNPFSNKKGKQFQFSRWFSSPSSDVKELVAGTSELDWSSLNKVFSEKRMSLFPLVVSSGFLFTWQAL